MVRSSALNPEERGSGRGHDVPWFKPMKTNPDSTPHFLDFSTKRRGLPPWPGEIQKDQSPPRWPQSVKLRTQQTWTRVRVHMRAHVSSHVCREQQVTLALLLLSQVSKQ